MYLRFHCLYHSLKVFFEEEQYFFADLPPNSVFPNLTLDARSSVIYNLYDSINFGMLLLAEVKDFFRLA